MHALNLGSDKRLITIDIICLTETQLQSRAKPRRFDYFKNLKWFMTKMQTNFRKSIFFRTTTDTISQIKMQDAYYMTFKNLNCR